MTDMAVAPRVAVVEDDDDLRDNILLPSLADYGFEVESFDSPTPLYRRMLAARFDIVVMDIGLPGESGLSAARYLRSISERIGIVILTGSRGRHDQVRALSDGADVYLSKPVDTEILAMMLRSLVRRLSLVPGGATPATETDADAPATASQWHMAHDGWCLFSPSGGMLALTRPERSLMKRLQAACGQPVGREDLIAALADNTLDFDPHRLDMLVHRLRRKAATISDDAHPFPLLAARGVGYMLAF